MKRLIIILFLARIVIFTSCSSLPPNSSENTAWKAMKEGKAKGTVQIYSVDADRSGEWGSLEKEISGLMPLFFLEKKYLVVSSSVPADYIAEVRVREREYPDGWRTRRSACAEVRLWDGENFIDNPLPLSAGRSMIQGKKSITSSKTLSVMLRKSVNKAVRGLPSATRLQSKNRKLNADTEE